MSNGKNKNLGCLILGAMILILSVYFLWEIYYDIENVLMIKRNHPTVFENIKANRVSSIKYGRKVEVISKEQYLKTKETTSQDSTFEPSKFVKENEKIIVKTEKGTLIFKDHYDDKCMACVAVYNLKGKVKNLEKVVIETEYFRRTETQIVDLKNGRIDTIPNVPIFSQDKMYMACNDFYSKDTIYGGLKIYSIYRDRINFMIKKGGKWLVDEMFWSGKKTVHAKVIMLEPNPIDWESFKYLKIDL